MERDKSDVKQIEEREGRQNALSRGTQQKHVTDSGYSSPTIALDFFCCAVKNTYLSNLQFLQIGNSQKDLLCQIGKQNFSQK
jgi:hypothetical protein